MNPKTIIFEDIPNGIAEVAGVKDELVSKRIRIMWAFMIVCGILLGVYVGIIALAMNSIIDKLVADEYDGTTWGMFDHETSKKLINQSYKKFNMKKTLIYDKVLKRMDEQYNRNNKDRAAEIQAKKDKK